MEELINRAKAIEPQLAELRRAFHAHPEPSRGEYETAERIKQELEAIGGYDIRSGVGGCGLLADLDSGKPGPKIALRADMDALQMTEETGLPCSSLNAGVMHACGHDNHMTMLLGAARLLADLNREGKLSGSVRLIFQPAEELSPNGGSRHMIAAGALDDVTAVFGMHVWPELPLGKVGVKAGPLMAASDHFSVHIEGMTSHAARPQEGVDAVVAGAQYVTALQTIASRNADPMKPLVITVGKFQAGTRYNIVAGSCDLEGTCRTFDPDIRDLAERRLNEVLQGVCQLAGCKGELNYERGYMAVMNDEAMAAYAAEEVRQLFGPEAAEAVKPAMTAEDFSFYLAEKPGAFLWIGTTAEGEEVWPLHSCHYSPNEGVLWRGAALLTKLVLDFKN